MIDDGNGIYGFFNEYRFLSNFSEDGFGYLGVWYKTNEHFYQASKASYQGDHLRVIAASTPGLAKRFGRQIECRPDWQDIKVPVMQLGLSLKFRPGSIPADLLLDTGDRYLEETNTWGDKYWGVCEGEGENMLGRLLMAQRPYLKSVMP
jgi:ribA/ribD-fused uncharacterized protein